MAKPKNLYSKPAITHKSQLKVLISRGLIVEDFHKSLHLIDKIGYFRLTGYFYPQLEIPKDQHVFKAKSYFESSFKMYCFDRELRILLLGHIEKIEVAFRSKLSYHLSLRYNPFWYTYDALFKDESMQKISRANIEKQKAESQEDFVKKYKEKYLDNNMPSWMVMEIVTFTHLSKTYSNLKDTSAKSLISNDFGVPYQLLESWLLTLTYTRNICAHHSRFWNRELAIKPLKSNKTLDFDWIDQTDIPRNRSYFYISIIKYLLDRISPKNDLTIKLLCLFSKYENIDYHKSMGFPLNWQEQPLWIDSEIRLLND